MEKKPWPYTDAMLVGTGHKIAVAFIVVLFLAISTQMPFIDFDGQKVTEKQKGITHEK